MLQTIDQDFRHHHDWKQDFQAPVKQTAPHHQQYRHVRIAGVA